MNEKNSLGLNLCFKEHNNPIKLFEEWFNKAKKTEINDPNAFAVGTVNKNGFPTVRMVLLKDFDKNGFVFYTNLNSDKSKAIKNTSKISMCFHWKSLQRQIRIIGIATKVSKKEADANGAHTTPSSAVAATPSARRPDKTRVVGGLITGKDCQPKRCARMVSMAIAMHQPHEGVDVEPSPGGPALRARS